MFEPAAVLVVLAGAAVGRLLALAPRRLSLLRWAAAAAVLALVVALIGPTRTRVQLARNEIGLLAHGWTRQIDRLHAVIAKDGGATRILGCGQAVTEVAFQSILAWEIGENVADIGWDPQTWIAKGKPIVLFEPYGAGWQIRPIHIPLSKRASCSRLTANTASS